MNSPANSNLIDQGFPIIEYRRGQSPLEWGRMHGEAYREGIRQLVQIRMDLMREKNPTLTGDIVDQLAATQWNQSEQFDPLLTEELWGICEGSNCSQAEIVILNNYTDFRDIQLDDQGCSVVWVNYGRLPIAGQTWDMHGTAKNYLACMVIPLAESEQQMIVLSLVGCLGLMGYTSYGTAVGVNNINTDRAVAGVIWPAVVRNLLRYSRHDQMVKQLACTRVTSGRQYLLASPDRADMWEVMPGLSECVGSQSVQQDGYLFHTNHCLGQAARRREKSAALSSTTHARFELLRKKIGSVRTFNQVYDLLNDHENYPLSICSNFQTNSQDPSITCGGAVGDLTNGRVTMWRGDAEYDTHFKRHEFQLAMAARRQNVSAGGNG